MAAQTTDRIINILCIEDDLFVGSIYMRALDRAGYKTTLEANGKKGLQLAQSGSYDIILLDLMLPDLSGIEILRLLRDPKQTPEFHSKIIIFTDFEESKSARADIERHADGYLVKALVTPRQLVEYLRQIDTSKTHL